MGQACCIKSALACMPPDPIWKLTELWDNTAFGGVGQSSTEEEDCFSEVGVSSENSLEFEDEWSCTTWGATGLSSRLFSKGMSSS